jgi:hypothetical protein
METPSRCLPRRKDRARRLIAGLEAVSGEFELEAWIGGWLEGNGVTVVENKMKCNRFIS